MSNFLELYVQDETAPLEVVVIGIAKDIGDPATVNNPKSASFVKAGQPPTEAELSADVENMVRTLEALEIEVLRPENVPGYNQIFTRDLAVVVGDQLVVGSLMKEKRKPEQAGMNAILDQIPNSHIHRPPSDVILEGGDIVQKNGYLFVGQGARSNEAGLKFLASLFPEKEVIPIPLTVSDDPYQNVLHLDCAFQPVGEGKAILFEDGIRENLEAIYDIFGQENLIPITSEELFHLHANILSLNPETVLSQPGFDRLNGLLRSSGIQVVEIPYQAVSKRGGLFRCSTMPLRRNKP